MPDALDWNQSVIEEFRANAGMVGGPFEGAPLLLLITTGAKTGLERTSPVMYLPDGDRYVVFASKGGAPTNPDWFHNLVANPGATVEVGTERLQVTAAIAEGDASRESCETTLRAAGDGSARDAVTLAERIRRGKRWAESVLREGLSFPQGR